MSMFFGVPHYPKGFSHNQPACGILGVHDPRQVWSLSGGYWHHHPIPQAVPEIKEHLSRPQSRRRGGHYRDLSRPREACHLDVHGEVQTGAEKEMSSSTSSQLSFLFGLKGMSSTSHMYACLTSAL